MRRTLTEKVVVSNWNSFMYVLVFRLIENMLAHIAGHLSCPAISDNAKEHGRRS